MRLTDMYKRITPPTEEQKADAKLFFEQVRKNWVERHDAIVEAHISALEGMTEAERFSYLYGTFPLKESTFVELRRL